MTGNLLLLDYFQVFTAILWTGTDVFMGFNLGPVLSRVSLTGRPYYMMGHTVSTYHDIQSKGVEFLRNIYSCAGLSIKPRDHYSKIDMLKEMMRAWGLEPEKILTREALAEPHRAYVSSEEQEEEEIRLLSLALRDSLKKEFLANQSCPS